MSTVTRTAPQAPDIEENVYPAKFLGVKDFPESQYGPAWKWLFEMYVEGEAMDIDGITNTSGGLKSKVMRWTSGLIGRQLEVDENVDLDDYVGRPCRLMIAKKEDGWPYIVNVLPSKG